jgi:hypothetical protein
MPRCFSRAWFVSCMVVCLALFSGLSVLPVYGQGGSRGTVSITVFDPSGSVVPGAALELVDLATNTVRTAKTAGAGTYSFVALPNGTYRLTVSKAGFDTQQNDAVTVQAGQVTDLNITLKVGTGSVKVVVNAEAAPLLQTTTNTIGTTIDLKQLADLPLSGRDVSLLAFSVPGYVATPGVAGGTWNGLPSIAQSNNIDGVISSTSRMKFAGNASPGPEARLDAISQMTVSTGQLGVDEGYGQAAMQTAFVTTRGSNNLHGRVYEDFRNSYLNANSWFNDAVGLDKNHLILNDFGGDVGGPILKNKLFFFGSFAMSKQPGGYTNTATVLTADAQKGIYTELDGTKVNLFSQVAGPNGLPTSANSMISGQISAIDGALSSGKLSPTSDPNLQTLSWFVPSPQTYYFPTVRVDYNVTQKVRMDVAWNETKYHQPGAGAPFFPGSLANTGASNKSSNYTGSLGVDWTISPTLINQFRGGYYYNAAWYAYDATNAYTTQPIVNWAYGESPQQFNLPITTYYPIINFSDGMTWQKNSHMLTFGLSFWREQDHYWNPPDGILTYSLGLVNGDPALSTFDSYFASASDTDRVNAENLYATLVGRISGVGPNGSGFPLDGATHQYIQHVGAFNLDELTGAWGFYVHDSWHIKPTLTLNYGMRWDLNKANHDLTGAYHSADLPNVYGPTAPDQIFQPGKLNGVQDPVLSAKVYAYQNYYTTPQPQVGFAWNPRHFSGLLGKLAGGGDTVVRGSFNLRRFTEPQQYYWNAASNYGFAFFQYFSLNPSSSGGTGTFQPGSLQLGDSLPAFNYDVQSYQPVYPQSSQTWFGYWGGVNGFNFNIRQPYMEEWTLELQRQLGQNNVVTVRYLGHHALHEWIAQTPYEANIFENGFLNEFKAAQANLKINAQNGMPGTFAYNGFSGQQPLPIFESAFSSEETSPYTAADYSNGTYLNYLNQGRAGSMAGTLDSIFGNAPYYCNLVGASFGPCANAIGYTGAGAGYPINFFQSNPFMSGQGTGLMNDAGYGNFNALQVELKQNNWHGMQFDANYQWAHGMGVEPNNNWTGNTALFTLRNERLNYGPSLFDIRQTLHVGGTYDLPFGNGKRFLNTGNPVLNRVVGGWTIGTIVTYQTGTPFGLSGGYQTFNDQADGGLIYSGVTNNQLQNSIGVYHLNGPYANGINPQYLLNGRANSQYLTPNSDPGTFGYHTWLYGQHFSNTDIAITKTTPIIGERYRFIFQGEFLNAFNHPNWHITNGNIRSSSFLQGHVINSGTVGARQIQLRASIEF